MRRALFVAGASAAVVTGAACFSDVDGLADQDPVPDGGAEASTDAGGDISAPTDGGAGDATDDADASACPHGMVGVSGFCIDATEVSQKDYYAFFLAKGGDTSGQPAECGWNTSYSPSSCALSATSDFPATGLDWCDAYAYCAWAGKRLCGRIGGGAELDDNAGATIANQWFTACSNAGANTYPYGNAYDPTRCNGEDRDAGGLLPVGTSGCEGGVAGLYDMSGNVEEWTDDCLPSADASANASDDECTRRGGDNGENSLGLRCAFQERAPRKYAVCYVGFRCCSK